MSRVPGTALKEYLKVIMPMLLWLNIIYLIQTPLTQFELGPFLILSSHPYMELLTHHTRAARLDKEYLWTLVSSSAAMCGETQDWEQVQ